MIGYQAGTAKVERGTYGRGRLPVGRMAHGEEMSLPLHIIAGARDGPTLVVICSQHGDEIGPIASLAALTREIDPVAVSGNLVIVPTANPLAFEMGVRATWFDALYNGTTGNMNRIWPGKADGFFTERITWAMSDGLLRGADCVIDIHASTSGSISIYYSFVATEDSPLGHRTRALNLAFGQEILIRWPGYPGTALHDFVYPELGIPCVSVELGTFYGLYRDRPTRHPRTPLRTVPEVGVTGVKNVMKALGMLEGSPDLPRRQVITSPEHRCLPAAGGILYPEVGTVDIGLDFPQGHVLGRVVDPVTFDQVDVITTPYARNLLLSARDIRPVSKVNPGDQSFHTADLTNAEWIENEN